MIFRCASAVAAAVAFVGISMAAASADPIAIVDVNDAFYGVQTATIEAGSTLFAATASFDISSFGLSHGPVEIGLTDPLGNIVGDITNFVVPGEGFDGFTLSVAGSGDALLGQACVSSASFACASISYGSAIDIDPIIQSLTGIAVLGGTADITLFPAPEPASLALLGAGLAGIGAIRRRRCR